MAQFVLRRFLYALLLLVIASVLIFYGLRVAPGNIVTAIASPTQAVVIKSTLTKQLGLDRPLAVQYFVFVGHVLQGNPGVSVVNGAPISTIIRESGLRTLELGLSAALPHVRAGDPARRARGLEAQLRARPGTPLLHRARDGRAELLPRGDPDPGARRQPSLVTGRRAQVGSGT